MLLPSIPKDKRLSHPDSALMSTVEEPAPSLLKIGDRNLNAIARRMVKKQQGIELMEIDGTKKYVSLSAVASR